MGHNLATTNGRTSMMYAGEVPWHGLGTRLEEPATAREAIEAASLNYLAELKNIQTGDGTPVPQRKAVVRSDSGDVLIVPHKLFLTGGWAGRKNRNNLRSRACAAGQSKVSACPVRYENAARSRLAMRSCESFH